MRYLMMIYSDEALDAGRSQEEQDAIMQAYFGFSEEVRHRGDGEALYPTSAATTVRVRDGKVLTTDGPFAETKEQLGGFYLLECQDLDEAIQIAAKIPSSTVGSIEIRPVVEFN